MFKSLVYELKAIIVNLAAMVRREKDRDLVGERVENRGGHSVVSSRAHYNRGGHSVVSSSTRYFQSIGGRILIPNISVLFCFGGSSIVLFS